MKVRIEEKDTFKMFGVERIISMEGGQNFIEIPAFWQECFGNGTVEALENVSGIHITDDYEGLLPVHAVMSYKGTGGNTFPYMIGCFVHENSKIAGYELIEIPASKWGIFTTEPYKVENTSDAVQGLWKKIFAEWFPTSGYEVAEGARLEVYKKGKGTNEFCEIWIPIK